MTVRRPVRFLAALTLIASTLTASAVAGTAPAAADPPPGPDYVPVGYQLDWSDEFPGVTLNANDWYKREGSKAICKNDPANVTVGAGVMHIALKAEQNGDTGYTCGGIISKKTFGYGYYETRAKLWGEKGFHSAFWQMGLADYVPDTPSYKGPYNRFNEIDGFEIDSHAPSTVQQHTHWTVPQHIGNPGGGRGGRGPRRPRSDREVITVRISHAFEEMPSAAAASSTLFFTDIGSRSVIRAVGSSASGARSSAAGSSASSSRSSSGPVSWLGAGVTTNSGRPPAIRSSTEPGDSSRLISPAASDRAAMRARRPASSSVAPRRSATERVWSSASAVAFCTLRRTDSRYWSSSMAAIMTSS